MMNNKSRNFTVKFISMRDKLVYMSIIRELLHISSVVTHNVNFFYL